METMENIFYTTWDSSALCFFSPSSPIHHKDVFKAQKAVWREVGAGGGERQGTVFPPYRLFNTMCNGRSEWPIGGLLQALAETHTNKCVLWILYKQNLSVSKRQNLCCAAHCHRWDMCNYSLLICQFKMSQRLSSEKWNSLMPVQTKHLTSDASALTSLHSSGVKCHGRNFTVFQNLTLDSIRFWIHFTPKPFTYHIICSGFSKAWDHLLIFLFVQSITIQLGAVFTCFNCQPAVFLRSISWCLWPVFLRLQVDGRNM